MFHSDRLLVRAASVLTHTRADARRMERRSHECERGTQECVRHVKMAWLFLTWA